MDNFTNKNSSESSSPGRQLKTLVKPDKHPKKLSHNELSLTDYQQATLVKDKADWVIKFRPVKYEYNQTEKAVDPVFNTIYSLDMTKSKRSIDL